MGGHEAALAGARRVATRAPGGRRSVGSSSRPPHLLLLDWLIRKDGWADLDEIRTIIAGLRQDQREFEPQLLDATDARSRAYRLVALYHWAKASELVGTYLLQGEPASITPELDQHFESAGEASFLAGDTTFELLLRWLHLAARRIVLGSLWATVRTAGTNASRFIENLTRARGLFELLPPQRTALQQQGLLDTALQAVVVDIPTSAGKTILAEFRILQALNQFSDVDGWVAYVAPTRASRLATDATIEGGSWTGGHRGRATYCSRRRGCPGGCTSFRPRHNVVPCSHGNAGEAGSCYQE